MTKPVGSVFALVSKTTIGVSSTFDMLSDKPNTQRMREPKKFEERLYDRIVESSNRSELLSGDCIVSAHHEFLCILTNSGVLEIYKASQTSEIKN